MFGKIAINKLRRIFAMQNKFKIAPLSGQMLAHWYTNKSPIIYKGIAVLP
jgi:hypothetical protein